MSGLGNCFNPAVLDKIFLRTFKHLNGGAYKPAHLDDSGYQLPEPMEMNDPLDPVVISETMRSYGQYLVELNNRFGDLGELELDTDLVTMGNGLVFKCESVRDIRRHPNFSNIKLGQEIYRSYLARFARVAGTNINDAMRDKAELFAPRYSDRVEEPNAVDLARKDEQRQRYIRYREEEVEAFRREFPDMPTVNSFIRGYEINALNCEKNGALWQVENLWSSIAALNEYTCNVGDRSAQLDILHGYLADDFVKYYLGHTRTCSETVAYAIALESDDMERLIATRRGNVRVGDVHESAKEFSVYMTPEQIELQVNRGEEPDLLG